MILSQNLFVRHRDIGLVGLLSFGCQFASQGINLLRCFMNEVLVRFLPVSFDSVLIFQNWFLLLFASSFYRIGLINCQCEVILFSSYFCFILLKAKQFTHYLLNALVVL